ncbi:MAG TPA: hypothetical protein VGA08_01810 [Candidatus Saccharimonadales bacterium]
MPPQLLAVRKSLRSLVTAAAAVAIVTGNLLSAYAASLTSASLSLSDPRTTQTATYTFTASGFSASAQCIVLSLNTQADGGGSAPSGIDTTGATLDSSGTMITEANWTDDFTTNGVLELTYATGETPANGGTLVFTGVDNGDTESTTYYGVFNTYSDTGCSTGLDSVAVAFVYRDGELVTLTIDPTLTFTCNSVGTGVSVNNGPNTTVVSGASGIDFGNSVTSSANGVSAHRLDVTTNASGGYVVYTRHTGNLANVASDTITNHTGTNAAPTAFPAAGTESWGYTTEDSTLTGGTGDRFTSTGGNKWAGFTTSNQPVMDNTAASAGTDQTNVGHQVGVASTTEAGTYTTTIVYTIVATY